MAVFLVILRARIRENTVITKLPLPENGMNDCAVEKANDFRNSGSAGVRMKTDDDEGGDKSEEE